MLFIPSRILNEICIFALMKLIPFILGLVIVNSCKDTPVHAPVGQSMDTKAMELKESVELNKARNKQERDFIQNWINKNNTQHFFSTSMGYWSSVDFSNRKPSGNSVYTYELDFYDFNKTKIYEKSTSRTEVLPAQVEEIKAVEDALKYLNEKEKVTLLVPSSLAFGASGDEDRIPENLPLIIELIKIK